MKSTVYTLLLTAGLALALFGCEKETAEVPVTTPAATVAPTPTPETQPAVDPAPTTAPAAGETVPSTAAGETVPTPGTVPAPAGE